jgi:multidrug efflux pump subunit AcrB
MQEGLMEMNVQLHHAVTDRGDGHAYHPRHRGRVAEVYRGYAEPPAALLRHNGAPAIGLGVAPVEGANVVELGEAVSRRVAALLQELPVGVEIGVIADQPREVRAAVTGFLRNLVTAVAIVLLVLLFSMGLRMGLIIGAGVPLTILGTFIVMWGLGIDLHRVSLGALVVVLGMLVDNAIVVAPW